MSKHIVSFSGGKDSTAMLLMMIERGMQIDEIIFCDTGMEFPQMYEHIKKVENYIGREITVVKHAQSFEYMLGERVQKSGRVGYGWPDFKNRWCTSDLKRNVIQRHIKKLGKVTEYHGIAADEAHRTERNRGRDIRYPLVEWGITEREALNYCYTKGFDWGGLYEIFNRVSCWCCPLQSLQELRNLYTYYPDLWKRLKEIDKKSWRQFRADYSVADLDAWFSKEAKQIKFPEMVGAHDRLYLLT